MAIPPKFAASKLALGKSPSQSINTIELYLDYVCPVSRDFMKARTSNLD